MRVWEIVREARIERNPRKPRIKGTETTFVDRTGRAINLLAPKRYRHYPNDPSTFVTVYAQHEGKQIAYLELMFDSGTWRVAQSWVDEAFRKAGIATALYDFAYREGFRPLRPSKVQSEDGKAFWNAHYQKPNRIHGTEWIMNRWHWSPTDGGDPGRPFKRR